MELLKLYSKKAFILFAGMNPWSQKELKDFLYYCCAECDFKDKSEDNFVKHATLYHPQSKEIFRESKEVDSEDTSNTQPVDDVNDCDIPEEDHEREVKSKELFEVIDEKVGSIRFKCFSCDYKSKYKQAVVHHAERIHLKKKTYKCDKCNKPFHQECDLKKHVLAVHEQLRRFVCEVCAFPCVSKQSLDKHRINKHQKSLLKCHYCPYSETSSKRFYNHYNTSHAKFVTCHVKCHLCHRMFDSDMTVELHIEFDHQATKYWCDQCGKQFNTKKGLAFHVSGVHENLKPYVCQTCNKAFPSKGNMETHIKIAHTKTGSVKCQICGQGSANIFYARKHMKEYHQHS